MRLPQELRLIAADTRILQTPLYRRQTSDSEKLYNAYSQMPHSITLPQNLFRTLLHELMTAKTRVHELEISA